MPFSTLGLQTALINAIKAKGYTTPTPIQKKAIPVILEKRDLLACARTGTGKTDAFALPLVELLSREKSGKPHPRALVLTPTRELAQQVGETIRSYAEPVSLGCTTVHGGARINPQAERIRQGIDILVATPGRLLDLSDRGQLDLSRLEFLVLDEADRMLDLGFSDEISEILKRVPVKRSTLLFSATYTRRIRKLAARLLENPAHIDVTANIDAADAIVQKVYKVGSTDKPALLIHLIKQENWKQVLVFTRTKNGANQLVQKLAKQGLVTAAMHGNKSQSFRTRTLREFKNGDIPVLVATDVAARGLDIRHLPYVVNYDMPETPEKYIHRIGRTGRAGLGGVAISLVSPDEVPLLEGIEKRLGQKFPVEAVEAFAGESRVPAYVLFRPDVNSGEKTDKEMIEKREGRKKSATSRKKKKQNSGSRKKRKPAFRSGRGNKR